MANRKKIRVIHYYQCAQPKNTAACVNGNPNAHHQPTTPSLYM